MALPNVAKKIWFKDQDNLEQVLVLINTELDKVNDARNWELEVEEAAKQTIIDSQQSVTKLNELTDRLTTVGQNITTALQHLTTLGEALQNKGLSALADNTSGAITALQELAAIKEDLKKDEDEIVEIESKLETLKDWQKRTVRKEMAWELKEEVKIEDLLKNLLKILRTSQSILDQTGHDLTKKLVS